MSDSITSWPVASGLSWVQTNCPQHARKLVKRGDTRLVAVGVAGGFLRVFEMRRSPAFMRRLVARYEAANERFQNAKGAKQGAKRRGRVTGRGKRQAAHKNENPHDGKSADFRNSNAIGEESSLTRES